MNEVMFYLEFENINDKENNSSQKYKVKAISNIVVYLNKFEGYLLGL